MKVMDFELPAPPQHKPTYEKAQTIVKFHGEYDATFSTLYRSRYGDFWLCRHMRCCFGSKVTIDTWMKPAPSRHAVKRRGRT